MKRLLLSFLLLGVSPFVGCGGSSGSGGTTPPTPTLQSITIAPANPSIAAGGTQQFSATGTYSDGSTKAVSANWLSASPSVATINTSGLATGVAAGTTNITATSGSITGQTTLTVTVVPLVSIAVTPATKTVAPNGTQQYTATGTYADQSTKIITATVTWTASGREHHCGRPCDRRDAGCNLDDHRNAGNDFRHGDAYHYEPAGIDSGDSVNGVGRSQRYPAVHCDLEPRPLRSPRPL